MNKKRFAAGLLCLVLILSFTGLPVKAAGGAEGENCTLTVGFHYEGKTAVPGVNFDIFYAGSFAADNTFEPADPFSKYPVSFDDLSQESWNALAETFKGYVQRDQISPLASGETDSEGWVTFEGLETGLYFVLGSSNTVEDYLYTALPFFAVLPEPDEDTGRLLYEVTAETKYERETITPETETVKILKIWKDETSQDSRPEKIEVTLICDGKEYDRAVLDDRNNWRYEWTGLESGHEWTAAETETENYTVRVEKNGNTITVTNTKTPPPDTPPVTPPPSQTPKPELPYTGMTRWPVPMLIIAGLVCIILGLIRRRSA